MKFKMLHDNVLVRRAKADDKSHGGIILAESAKKKPLRGEVLAVGPGLWDDHGQRIPIEVSVGDQVYIEGEYATIEVSLEGEDYLVVRARDVAAVLS